MLWKIFTQERRIYLDYAAATPIHTSVRRAMAPFFSDTFANPSAIHREGQHARKAVEEAREMVARVLKIKTEDVTFTSGGTEANNLALFGVVDAVMKAGKACSDIEIISTAIEHPSILEALKVLQARGVVIHYVPVDEYGRIIVLELEKLISPNTLLITFAYVNSEIGTVQDVKRITRLVRTKKYETYVHIDASQAPLWLPCAMDMLGVDLMTLDAGKCYGPKGVGVLAHRPRVHIAPHVFGGDQERGLRAGTENVPLIVGCAHALVRTQVDYERRATHVRALRDFFIDEISRAIPHAILNGPKDERIANNINVSIKGIDGEFAVVTLDVHGVATSTRSACAGGKGGGSHVVREISGEDARATSTIRFTLSEETTKKEIVRAIEILKQHITSLDLEKK